MIFNLSRPQRRDGDILTLPGGAVRLRVNPRARRISLRLDARTGEVLAIAPSQRRLKEAEAFALSRSDWIAQRLQRTTERTPLTTGVTLPYRGGTLTLAQGLGAAAARLSADGATLIAGGDAAGFERRVVSWLRRQARAQLLERTAVHAAALGAAMPTVSVNDARTRWGSCTTGRSAIRYSWRLICAPDAVLDYVAAHEVAHLKQANHGPAFWALVRDLYGDPTAARRWLRTHGAALHAIG